MDIKRIGNYTIFRTDSYKQIYDNKLPRMLQTWKDKIYFVDTNKSKVLATAKKVMKLEKLNFKGNPDVISCGVYPKPIPNGHPKPQILLQGKQPKSRLNCIA